MYFASDNYEAFKGAKLESTKLGWRAYLAQFLYFNGWKLGNCLLLGYEDPPPIGVVEIYWLLCGPNHSVSHGCGSALRNVRHLKQELASSSPREPQELDHKVI